MPLSFANAVGNLFNRIGKLGALISNARSNQNTQLTALTNTTTGVVAQYNGESDIQAAIGSSYIGILNSIGSIGNTAASVAATTVNRMVFRDNPQLGNTLQSGDTLTSMQEVIRQMKIAGATVLAQTITLTASAWTGTGNGIINTSTRRPSDGLVLENAYAEDMRLTCTSDSYLGGTAAGNESFTVTGEGQQTNPFAFDWPLGSGASAGLSAIDGNSDNSAGNFLVNSGFETWSANLPGSWTILNSSQALIADENSIVYDPVTNGSSLRITGDSGGTLAGIKQQFDTTATALDELTQYSWCGFLRRDGTAAAAGVLTIDLVDGNDVVIQDANGVNNSFTIDLTALTTNWVAYTGVFRTPAVLPSAQYIRYRLTTALTNGRSVYVDKTSLGEFTQCYIGGPYLAIHAGSIPFVQETAAYKGDYATVTVTNSRGSGGTLDTFQTLVFRLLNNTMAQNELILPSSSTPTISDAALIA